MQMTQLVRKIGPSDVKIFGRDRFFVFMFCFVLVISVILRFGLPWLNVYLAETGVLPGNNIPHSLSDFYPLLVAFFAVFEGTLLTGTIFGFALLDEKENNTIKAMLVTPVPLSQYLMYRMAQAAIITFIIVVAMVLFINQALLPLWQLLLISAGASLTTPIIVLYYVTFSENKVQGMAMGKFVGIAGWIIVLGWFVAEPWQWLFGLFPPFWINKAYWMAYDSNRWWWVALILGIVLQAGLIAWLARRFNKVAYR